MAETPVPQPPIPKPVFIGDLVMKTQQGFRRNRFYYVLDLPATTITAVEICAEKLFGVITPKLKQLVTAQVELLRVEGRFFGADGSDIEGNSTSPKVLGDITAVTPGSESDDGSLPDTMPDESVLIIQKRTGTAGRGARGRWFFSGLGEAVQNNGVIVEGFQDDAKELADVLSEDIDTGAGDFTTTMHARHWNRDSNTLMPITKCYAIRVIGTRKERRNPLQLERL